MSAWSFLLQVEQPQPNLFVTMSPQRSAPRWTSVSVHPLLTHSGLRETAWRPATCVKEDQEWQLLHVRCNLWHKFKLSLWNFTTNLFDILVLFMTNKTNEQNIKTKNNFSHHMVKDFLNCIAKACRYSDGVTHGHGTWWQDGCSADAKNCTCNDGVVKCLRL